MRRIDIRFIVLLLMVTLLLTGCGFMNSDKTDTTSETTETQQKEQVADEGIDTMENSPDSEPAEEVGEGEEEGEIDVNLLDRALLESIKYKLPDTYMKVAEENSGDEVDIVTTYMKGFSRRVETLSEGVTDIEIYNDKEGITYSYKLGEATGYMLKDTEDDIEKHNEEKAMLGSSLMSILEKDMLENMSEDIIIKADRDRVAGRKAIMIEFIDPSPEEDEYTGSWQMWFDSEYTVDLKMVWDFDEEWMYSSETTEIEFNLRLKDELFEAPKGVVFTE